MDYYVKKEQKPRMMSLITSKSKTSDSNLKKNSEENESVKLNKDLEADTNVSKIPEQIDKNKKK